MLARPRVDPLPAPYAPELQAIFDRVMPRGVPPLSLFSTLARVPRFYDQIRAASLLDRGPLSLRHRELLIDRTCARCKCEYEWGVHMAFFSEHVRFSRQQVEATVIGDASDPLWSIEERLVIRLVDELHESSAISDALWIELTQTFALDQIFEFIALVGQYHTIAFFANSLRLVPEQFAARFPEGATSSAK